MGEALKKWAGTIDNLDALVTAREARAKRLREFAETLVEDCQAVFLNTGQGKRVLAFLEAAYLTDPPSAAELGAMRAEDIKATLAAHEAASGVVRALKLATEGKVIFTLTD
jgi:hypothetical protein